jgi:hypothetical protein
VILYCAVLDEIIVERSSVGESVYSQLTMSITLVFEVLPFISPVFSFHVGAITLAITMHPLSIIKLVCLPKILSFSRRQSVLILTFINIAIREFFIASSIF